MFQNYIHLEFLQETFLASRNLLSSSKVIYFVKLYPISSFLEVNLDDSHKRPISSSTSSHIIYEVSSQYAPNSWTARRHPRVRAGDLG